MIVFLLAGVLLLAFANGANDNFKGVATLWGTGRYRYRTVLAWATLTTFAGSLLGGVLAQGLVEIFSGRRFLGSAAVLDTGFLPSVALGAAATVLLATRLGAPVSTTHALLGSLIGAGLLSVGASNILWVSLGTVIILPLLFSPLAAMGLTMAVFPLLERWLRTRNCVCVTEPVPVLLPSGLPNGYAAMAAIGVFPSLRIAHRAECNRGDELSHRNTEELTHWLSAGLISFSRGLHDTPKIAALVLSAGLLAPGLNYLLIASAMALGGWLGARRVARTISQRVTPIAPVPGLSANLVGAVLVGAASRWGLPVSTTHVTLGGIFGVGAGQREQTNWPLVRRIGLAWLVTLPLGLVNGLVFYYLLKGVV